VLWTEFVAESFSETHVPGVARERLDVAPDAKISARSTRSRLGGRTPKRAGSNRQLFNDRKAHDQLSEMETVIVLGDIKNALVDEVRRVYAPMFMLFDFQEFAQEVYDSRSRC
jgi:hypothetical protein